MEGVEECQEEEEEAAGVGYHWEVWLVTGVVLREGEKLEVLVVWAAIVVYLPS